MEVAKAVVPLVARADSVCKVFRTAAARTGAPEAQKQRNPSRAAQRNRRPPAASSLENCAAKKNSRSSETLSRQIAPFLVIQPVVEAARLYPMPTSEQQPTGLVPQADRELRC